MNPPAILFSLEAVKHDPALQIRGDRKVVVTELYPEKEEVATKRHWRHAMPSGRCPVVVMPDTESAVFTQVAKQTRHCHRVGTEIYVLIEGRMTIEVEGSNYTLAPGDTIMVMPGAYHQIRREGRFLCRVFTVNCGGVADRYE
jgi:mannose-6-phosphate isomerase-like protein (cupin superfamily)